MEGLCIVCGEILGKYESIHEHLFKRDIMDTAHTKYEGKVMDSNYKEPCFCGGGIIKTGSFPDSWQVVCEKCGYIWAED